MALSAVLVVAALTQPLSGYVFVLTGADRCRDGRYLAMTAVIQTAAFVPLALAIAAWGPTGTAGLVRSGSLLGRLDGPARRPARPSRPRRRLVDHGPPSPDYPLPPIRRRSSDAPGVPASRN